MIALVPDDELSTPVTNRWERILIRVVYSMAVSERLSFRLPSVREFVKLTGASLITVNRVFNELDALGLIIRKHGSGYYPKREVEAGDLLKLVKPERLAFVLSSLKDEANYQRYDLFFFIQRRLAQVNGSIEFCLRSDLLKGADASGYDGFFVLSAKKEILAKLHPQALVCVGNYPELSADYVGTQIGDGCRYVVDLILREKRKHLCIMIPEGIEERLGREMADRLREALIPLGVEVESIFSRTGSGYSDLKRWLRKKDKTSVILTMHCHNTGEAIRACENLDLGLGKRVKLVAWGSANVALLSVGDFFVLRSDRQAMADELLRLLLLRSLNPSASRRCVELPILR